MTRSVQDEHPADQPQADLRESERDEAACIGVSSFTFLHSGAILEGVARDVSDGGARISGSVEGLSIDDTVELELAVRDNKVRYLARVKHVDAENRFYGLEYLAGPTVIEPETAVDRQCLKCRRDYEPPWRFCGICGSDLVRKPR